jgi:membrane fusion protein (multidrug efflux system)
VQLGARINDKVVVKQGLEINQQIVTDGVQKIRDGAMVQVSAPNAGKTADSAKGK